ncbi:unnamed protein product [Rotaria sp. Silwood2]|nr:unnamed protein product [Rotaria sp. Silwood2]CAF2710440.1 unnamed protein product [Rotaria sp. Silwood2]CAF3020401.1 unnamed protein product [Rotaria sp. Silwood2]CAF4018463.1 unnamed protein product [Rotaria sp. Silwood2]CAF4303989.1 unnamed protein product [Rotaria sp. Silwood2]
MINIFFLPFKQETTTTSCTSNTPEETISKALDGEVVVGLLLAIASLVLIISCDASFIKGAKTPITLSVDTTITF